MGYWNERQWRGDSGMRSPQNGRHRLLEVGHAATHICASDDNSGFACFAMALVYNVVKVPFEAEAFQKFNWSVSHSHGVPAG